MINLKLKIKLTTAVLVVFAFAKAYSNNTNFYSTNTVLTSWQVQQDTNKVANSNKRLIDGVNGVIGDYVMLESDIVKNEESLKRNNNKFSLTRCELMENMLREKMFAHHATQDSIAISDGEVNGMVENQIEYFRRGLPSDKEIAEFYNMENIQQVRDQLARYAKDQLLARRMQERLTEEVTITPEEVRQWFYGLPEDKRPLFNREVAISRILITPKATDDEVQETINDLKKIKADLESGNGSADFALKASVYSADTATENSGGIITVTRQASLVKEFKDVAFSLEEGEISEPFKTAFGYHIIKLVKIKGQQRDVRHILIIPFVSTSQVNKTRALLEQIREDVLEGKTTFAEAAKEYSEDENTKFNGGKLLNPSNGGLFIDLARVDEQLDSQTQLLQKGDISSIIPTENQNRQPALTIVMMNDFISDHDADYTQDYLKIKDLALQDKQVRVVEEWTQEKLKDTYLKIVDEFKSCDFITRWSK